MSLEVINPLAVEKSAKLQSIGKTKGAGENFGAMLDAVNAMAPAASTANQVYGSQSSQAVLAAAFSGLGAGSQAFSAGGGTPSYAGGFNGGSKSMGLTTTAGAGGLGTPVFGTDTGFSQMDMINTMNQNNMGLLEMQAVMQSNMQEWNTKSNILSADHRSRMAMIEKFTAR